MDIYKVFIVIVTVRINTANIPAIRTNLLSDFLYKRTDFLKTVFYLLSKHPHLLERMPICAKDFFYLNDCQLIGIWIMMTDVFLKISLSIQYHFLINLHTDTNSI
ncbi:MAG: hypothetical protein FJ241_00020 [Nitrospira sp.]|nr:hypothetical protein [Nitrospira sp.]